MIERVAAHPTPYTLNPSPHTLHPLPVTTYTLHPSHLHPPPYLAAVGAAGVGSHAAALDLQLPPLPCLVRHLPNTDPMKGLLHMKVLLYLKGRLHMKGLLQKSCLSSWFDRAALGCWLH